MEKAHSRIKWENYPSIATPLNETNLNKMDIALDEVDNRVLGLDSAKLDKATANTMVKDVSFVEETGIFTVTLLDGTTKTFDTKLEKIATNFRYDYEKQKLIIDLADGTKQEVDLSTLISNYEFVDGDVIAFNIGSDGTVTANVKDGTITESKLQPNFLADVKTEVAKAKSHSDGAYENAVISSNASQEAKTYRDEAKQYRDETQALSNIGIATTEVAGLVKPDGTTITVDEDGTIHSIGSQGTVDYNELENKPYINGTELDGNKSLDELGIASKTKVETLEKELEETTFKVDTVISNVDLGIKETASGEEIHLTDSAEGKAVEYALYGKATQDGEPSPDYPQEIEVSGESGSVEVKSVGKNYYDLSTTIGINASSLVEQTKNSIRIHSSKEGTYHSTKSLIDSLEIEAGKTYTFSADVLYTSGVGKLALRSVSNNGIIFQTPHIKSSGKYSVTFTMPEEECYLSLFATMSTSEIGDVTYSNIQLEAGEVVTEYQAYKETTSTIQTPNGLAGIKVSSGGNYTDQNGQQWICDEIVKYADGSGAYIQRVVVDTFVGDSSEGWIVDPSKVSLFQTQCVKSTIHNAEILSNKYICRNVPAINLPNNSIKISDFLYIKDERFTTLNEFLADLLINPLVVAYRLASPITTPLTAEELAEIPTFYPVTNISNDFDCGMSVKYNADSKNYIDKKISEMFSTMNS